MKFSVNWLRDFVELPDDTQALCDLLTFAGVEIEGVEHRGGDFPHVVVAQIRESVQHPNADRLSVCQVDDGSGSLRQIVCGAKNYKAGDKVPLAQPGAALPNGLKIKASKLRGVESQGMLCSPSELGMAADSDGLMILAPDAPVGAPFSSLFEPDTILDVEITPNRPDLLSHLGLAREIAALSSRPLKEAPGPAAAETSAEGVTITARHQCPFYSALRIEEIRVEPSPTWLRERIQAAGIRAINNIVDITNYVMLELGQPLHAFDADKLSGAIVVRLARPDEPFLALDGREYRLSPDDLVIADQERSIAIGGVMGGEDTGVSESTRNVLLESAYFLPASIRRTARALNLPSDASYRFERGVDPATTLRASARAAELIRDIAGGKPAARVSVAGDLPRPPDAVALRYDRCARLLGVQISTSVIDDILVQFGLEKVSGSEGASTWKIPGFRRDLQREADLIEEVVRAYGIGKIPARERARFAHESDADRASDNENAIRQLLTATGFFEARTSALISREEAGAAADGAVSLKNPLTEDHAALRPSLIPGLRGVLSRNLSMGATTLRLFELGTIFTPPSATETRSLALLVCGDSAAGAYWRGASRRPLDLFDLKGAIESLRIPMLEIERSESPEYAVAGKIKSSGTVIGFLGQLKAAQAATFGTTDPVCVAELALEALVSDSRGATKFAEIGRFPAITRDVALIVDETVPHSVVEQVIRRANEPLLQDVRLFDLFAGEPGSAIGEGRKSLAYTLTYRDKNRTLTNDEIVVVHTRIRERLKSELGAELRE